MGMVSSYSDGPDKLALSLGIKAPPVVDTVHMRDDENVYEVQLLFKENKGSWYCNICSKAEVVQLLKGESNWDTLETAIDHIMTDRVKDFTYRGNDDEPTDKMLSGISYLNIRNLGPVSYLA
jgi:hypothetical protein